MRVEQILGRTWIYNRYLHEPTGLMFGVVNFLHAFMEHTLRQMKDPHTQDWPRSVREITTILRGTKLIDNQMTFVLIATASTYEWLIMRRSLSLVSKNGSQVSCGIVPSALFDADLTAFILQSIYV